jgi:hypothetical protein
MLEIWEGLEKEEFYLERSGHPSGQLDGHSYFQLPSLDDVYSFEYMCYICIQTY